MSALQSLAPWALVLVAIYLIAKGLKDIFIPADRTVTVIVAIVAIIAGGLLFIAH